VESLISILHDFVGPEELEIFSSSSIKAGDDYQEKIMHALDDTDIFLLMANYSTPPQINDWCIFETGYFSSKITEQDPKKIISLVKDGGLPPDPIKNFKSVEDNREGIEQLVMEIYKDLRDDLFQNGRPKKRLEDAITEILDILKPRTLITQLAPRVWITIKKDKFKAFQKGEIPLPMDSTISGETEIFTRQRVVLVDDKELTLDKFDQIVDYPNSLPHFFALLEEIIRDILRAPRRGPWRVPPLRVMKDTPPRIMVPSALERCADGNYRFEFFVTEPPPYVEKGVNQKFAALYNLFIITWHFRWRVVEKHLEQLARMKNFPSTDDGRTNRLKIQIRKQLKELKLDMEAIFLDSINRNLEYEEDVTKSFVGDDKKIMKNMVDTERGLWIKIKPIFDEALENENVSEIIRCLKAWRDLNKTGLILTLKRLKELAEDGEIIDGNILEGQTTREELLERCGDS
jgi:hypothetical protein